MEAVYTLLGVDRGVPEVFASCYDVRMLMNSASRLMDGKKLADIKVPFIVRQLEKKAVEKSRGTIIHELLEQYFVVPLYRIRCEREEFYDRVPSGAGAA